MSQTGLTTLFNLITQASTTVCANGQCITVTSNAIAGNLAAFGVTVADINTFLMPLVLLLLLYSLYNIYHSQKEEKETTKDEETGKPLAF